MRAFLCADHSTIEIILQGFRKMVCENHSSGGLHFWFQCLPCSTNNQAFEINRTLKSALTSWSKNTRLVDSVPWPGAVSAALWARLHSIAAVGNTHPILNKKRMQERYSIESCQNSLFTKCRTLCVSSYPLLGCGLITEFYINSRSCYIQKFAVPFQEQRDFCFGEPPEIRTPDPLIKSQMLCQLS